MKFNTATVTDIAYSPSMNLNLCSLSRQTKMDRKFWSVKRVSRWRRKSLMFDIVVKTSTWLLYFLDLKHMANLISYSEQQNIEHKRGP